MSTATPTTPIMDFDLTELELEIEEVVVATSSSPDMAVTNWTCESDGYTSLAATGGCNPPCC